MCSVVALIFFVVFVISTDSGIEHEQYHMNLVADIIISIFQPTSQHYNWHCYVRGEWKGYHRSGFLTLKRKSIQDLRI